MDNLNGVISYGYVDTFFNELDDTIHMENDSDVEEVPENEYELLRNQDANLSQFEMAFRPISSVQQEKAHIKKFKTFLKNQNMDDNIETCAVDILAQKLRFFYNSLKKNNGEPYSGTSLLCIRAAIHRYLSTSPVNRAVNIITDNDFMVANNMLKAKVGEWLKTGSITKHFEAIQDADLLKLKGYFDQSNPVILQQEIWFSIVYHFGNRGRESIHSLLIDDFRFDRDSDNNEYVHIKKALSQKNVKSSLKKCDFDQNKQGRMYANPSGSDCPLRTFRLYLSKIHPSVKHIFPKAKNCPTKGIWYSECQVLGKTPLGNMMRTISEAAGLSQIYTNHSIRPTLVTNLREKGFNRNEVCAITGHKNEKSLDRYDKTLKERTLLKMSNSLCRNTTIEKQEVATAKGGYTFQNCTFNDCTF